MTACAGSEGRSVPRTSGCSEKAAGRPRPAGSHLLPGGPHRPLAPRSLGSPDSEPSPGPARPGPGLPFCTALTSHATAAPGGAEAGPGGGSRRDGRGGSPGRGAGGSPGRGWVPQRRFQLFRCLKLAPAERCGHVTERRQSAPACLRVPAPNARRPEERRPRPGGRVRRSPGLEGRREGRAGGGQRAAPPRLSQGVPVVDFLPGQRTSLCRWATRSASPGLRSSPRCCAAPAAGSCPAGAPPRPASRKTGVHLLTGQTLRSRRHGGRSGRPFPRPTVWWRGSTEGDKQTGRILAAEEQVRGG